MPGFENLQNQGGEPKPKILSNSEALRQGTEDLTALMNRIPREEKKMENATQQSLLEYIKVRENDIKTDPRIKATPGMENLYRNAQRKAMALLEKQGIELVTAKILAARKILNPNEKAKATETIINDLNYMTNFWQEEIESDIPVAQSEKFRKLKTDAEQLRDAQYNA